MAAAIREIEAPAIGQIDPHRHTGSGEAKAVATVLHHPGYLDTALRRAHLAGALGKAAGNGRDANLRPARLAGMDAQPFSRQLIEHKGAPGVAIAAHQEGAFRHRGQVILEHIAVHGPDDAVGALI